MTLLHEYYLGLQTTSSGSALEKTIWYFSGFSLRYPCDFAVHTQCHYSRIIFMLQSTSSDSFRVLSHPPVKFLISKNFNHKHVLRDFNTDEFNSKPLHCTCCGSLFICNPTGYVITSLRNVLSVKTEWVYLYKCYINRDQNLESILFP